MEDTRRSASWGHWAITLYTGDVWGDYRTAIAVGGVTFPCGPQGPVDGYLGSATREAYRAAIRAWMEHGEILPPLLRYDPAALEAALGAMHEE